MALRLCGHLLLGFARIYYQKTMFLYDESNEILFKIKLVYRPGVVDMEESVANLNAITMAQTFGDFEIHLPGEIDMDLIPKTDELFSFNLNVARVTDITNIPEEVRKDKDTTPIFSLDFFSQRDSSAGNEFESIKPGLEPEFEQITSQPFDPSQFIPEVAPEVPEPPELAPEPAPPEIGVSDSTIQAPFERVDTSSVSERELAISDLAELTPAQLRLKRKILKVDRRTELSKQVMMKTIDNPRTLLRSLERAPPTRQAMKLRQQEIDGRGFGHLLIDPIDDNLAPILRNIVKRTMKNKDEMDLPKKTTEDSSVEQERADNRMLLSDDLPPPDFSSNSNLPNQTDIADVPLDVPYQIPLEAPPEIPPEIPDFVEPPSVVVDRTDISKSGDTSLFTSGEEEGGLIITKKTAATHRFISKKFESGENALSFEGLFLGQKRKTVASAFFELLNIRSKNCINMTQEEHYQDLQITKTPYFDRLTST